MNGDGCGVPGEHDARDDDAVRFVFDLPRSVVQKSVHDVWKWMFESYENKGHGGYNGPGYERILQHVKKHVESMDFGQAIAEECARQLGAVVKDVVHERLKAHLKKVAKEMADEGTLLAKEE